MPARALLVAVKIRRVGICVLFLRYQSARRSRRHGRSYSHPLLEWASTAQFSGCRKRYSWGFGWCNRAVRYRVPLLQEATRLLKQKPDSHTKNVAEATIFLPFHNNVPTYPTANTALKGFETTAKKPIDYAHSMYPSL